MESLVEKALELVLGSNLGSVFYWMADLNKWHKSFFVSVFFSAEWE